MYFFIADTHFGSKESLIRENRPYSTAESFIEDSLAKYNSQVSKNDILFHLGDFINYNKYDHETWINYLGIAKRINCEVILIIGNNEERIIHDIFNDSFERFKNFCLSAGFSNVYRDLIIEMRSKKFYLNHYPSKHSNKYDNLFGHTHRTTGLWKPFGLNVGCDLNHFYLFSEDEIFRLLGYKSKFWDYDEDNLCMK